MAFVVNVVVLCLCSGVWEWWGLLWLALRAWARPATTYPPAPSQIHVNAVTVDLTESLLGYVLLELQGRNLIFAPAAASLKS